MNTQQLCAIAINSVQNNLTDLEYAECHKFNNHRELLLSLEFAIDFMSERDEMVDETTYSLFEAAFLQMDEKENGRLDDLKKMVKSQS